MFRRLSLCGLDFSVFAVASRGRAADALPMFGDPGIIAFVKSCGDFTDNYAVVMRDYLASVKGGDSAKMQAEAQKMQTITTEATAMQSKSATISGKVKPEEVDKFSKYL